ncbi:hypothetical protein DAEQUDRAFT_531846 [Daedalea quercina L-15889]|uniref:Uncharacterized protein n=1 Tax=Daedalea quercina L-15889 TaxID=1314783 RepID=A0A165M8U8_9APHY|nr:hypothetical protein DAEQUDRAFT_531846 [Daedalea quercina L-15889]
MRGAELACWRRLDCLYSGPTSDLVQWWKVSSKIRWLLLHACRIEHAWKILSIARRTSPIVLSMMASPRVPTLFWQQLPLAASRVRYLDLRLYTLVDHDYITVWELDIVPALSKLPLVALRVCRIHNMYLHAMGEERVHVDPTWRLEAAHLAEAIAKQVTSLQLISIGNGVEVMNNKLHRYRFCGHAMWWRIVPVPNHGAPLSGGVVERADSSDFGEPEGEYDDEDESDVIMEGEELGEETQDVDEKPDDVDEIDDIDEADEENEENEDVSAAEDSEDGDDDGDGDDDNDGSTIEDHEHDYPEANGDEDCGSQGSRSDSEGSMTRDRIAVAHLLTRILGPNKSRRMVSISRDLSEYAGEYMESSNFTETSAFDDDLWTRLEHSMVPREPVSEPHRDQDIGF